MYKKLTCNNNVNVIIEAIAHHMETVVTANQNCYKLYVAIYG